MSDRTRKRKHKSMRVSFLERNRKAIASIAVVILCCLVVFIVL